MAYATNHRPIQLQFNMKPLVHTSLDSINLHKKKINSNDMINVRAYITERFKLYKHHKIQDKMEKLLPNPTTPNKLNIPRELLTKRMNQIDNKLTLISLQAERSIKSRPIVHSSPTINKR
jgi:hypothetical protein